MVFLTKLADFPSEYRKAYDEVVESQNKTTDCKKKLEIFDKFAEAYTMIYPMWINVFE